MPEHTQTLKANVQNGSLGTGKNSEKKLRTSQKKTLIYTGATQRGVLRKLLSPSAPLAKSVIAWVL
jgi:hypothetical protein